jgi:ankyrin repeat protein
VVVQQLLERADVDPNCRNKHGQTPLSCLGHRGYDRFVRLLLEKGADVNRKDERRRRTALHQTTSEGYGAVAELLLEKNIRRL